MAIALSKLKKLWDVWDLRLFMTTSLILQAFLLILAPSRQRSRSNLLSRSVWASYLLADWIAAVAIGLITKSLGKPKGDDDIYALWASFLLMHLGGPDGITSLSLEDNELWIRHLFGLFLQVMSAAYSLYLTLSHNKLWGPNILIFIGGLIKFGERTWALRLASLDHFGATTLQKPNPGPDYEEAEQVYSTMRSVQAQRTITELMAPTMAGGGVSNSIYGHTTEHISTNEGRSSQNLDEMKLLNVAYSHYGTFKGLIVGFLLSSKDRESSRSYFLHENAANAFRLVEYELSFMYQVLHTKAVVIHGKIGYSLRVITICSTVLGFLIFMLIGKHSFNELDISVTYALFIGAIVLETFSAFKLIISDWFFMAAKADNWITRHVPKAIMQRKRWSRSVSQKDIISHCLAPKIEIKSLVTCIISRPEQALKISKKRFLCKYSYWKTVDEYLKEFIFEELKSKSKKAINLREAMEACSERGEAALLQNTCAEAKRFCNKHNLSCHAMVCEKILSVKPKVRSTAMKGDRSKSVLFDACILAQQLRNEESQWKIMSRVWVEMLSYAAIHCRPFIHAQQLSKGGELLSFTWLLMNHLGLGTQFAGQEQQAGTRMVTII